MIIDLRRDLHTHPELSFAEKRTTRVLRELMLDAGYTELPCPTETGCIFELDTGRPGRSIVYRADIDALPIDEESAQSYRSRSEGVMHACGHDAHAAIAVGTARELAGRAEEQVGRHVFLFQPAEETMGGARAMIDGGVLEVLRGDLLLSHHVSSPLPPGTIRARPGIAMSRADVLIFELEGQGGHGARASETGNVVLAASEIASRLAGVVTGMSYEGTDCACSAGLLHAGRARNVVPRRARVEGTLRTFEAVQLEDARARIDALLAEVRERFAVKVHLDVPVVIPRLENDPALTRRIHQLAGACGLEGAEMEPIAPSDDVSEFMRHIPGCHFFVGAMPKAGPVDHHTPEFDIDESVLEPAAKLLARAGSEWADPTRDPR